MDISETKKQLHTYIDMIENETQIEMLHEAAEAYLSKQPDVLDMLTPEQLEKMKESQEEIRNGGGIPHEEIMKRAKQWLTTLSK